MERKLMEELLEDLGRRGTSPVKKVCRCGGRSTCFWYVDDDDDRFVEVDESEYGTSVLCVARDGDVAEVVVLREARDVVEWVGGRLEELDRAGRLGCCRASA